MNNKIIECDSLYKIYKTDDIEVFALQGLDLDVEEGEFLAIIGSSGSGKSTLMNILGGLDKPTTGKCLINGIDMFSLSDRQMREYKRDVVGFVWQNNARNLLSHLTSLENIELVMKFSNKNVDSRARALELLEMVGMSHRKDSTVSQMSGGEQQRIAIAIALANQPKILLADEPTGSVDSNTSSDIFKLFKKLNEALKLTIIVVTHDMSVAHKVNRVVSISDGKIQKELVAKVSSEAALDSSEILYSDINDEATHEEFLVVDKYGRVQLPMHFLNDIGISGKSKIKAKLDNNQILLFPPDLVKS